MTGLSNKQTNNKKKLKAYCNSVTFMLNLPNMLRKKVDQLLRKAAEGLEVYKENSSSNQCVIRRGIQSRKSRTVRLRYLLNNLQEHVFPCEWIPQDRSHLVTAYAGELSTILNDYLKKTFYVIIMTFSWHYYGFNLFFFYFFVIFLTFCLIFFMLLWLYISLLTFFLIFLKFCFIF